MKHAFSPRAAIRLAMAAVVALTLTSCYIDQAYVEQGYHSGGYGPGYAAAPPPFAPVYHHRPYYPVREPGFGHYGGGHYGGGHSRHYDRSPRGYGHDSRSIDQHARQVGADDFHRGQSKRYSRHDRLFDSRTQNTFKNAYYSGYEAARARDRR
ncbi:hypothetical protein BH23VER1_BH23VER1_12020 [soil metagenome]